MSKPENIGSWKFHETGEADVYLIVENNDWVLGLRANGRQSVEQQKERMQRIVDCVNAMQGIDDPIAFRTEVDRLINVLNARTNQ